MRIFGYLRVSGDSQVDGDGFHRQKDAIESFCRSHNLTLSGFIREEGVSGTVEDRPALTELMLDQPDVIIVERLDRLARDLMVQEFLIQEFAKDGIVLYSTDQGGLINMADNTADPTRKLIRQILGAFAEYDKSALVLKLRKARERKRRETGKCEGRKKFGEHPDRLDEKRICQTVLSARQLGATFRGIQLAVRAVHGKEMSLSTIHSVLSRYGANRREVAMHGP